MTDQEANTNARALVDALADASRHEAAFRALLALGESGREAVLAGIGDGRWEVRRACAIWLLRFPAPGDFAVLAPLLRDPKRKVRQAAVVVVGLARAPAASADAVPLLIERALEDESLRVRRQALSLLAWNHSHPDLTGFFAQLAESEGDAKLRAYARMGLHLCRKSALGRGLEPRSC